MKNFRAPGNVLNFVAPGAIVSGTGYVIGNRFLVAMADGTTGDTIAGVIRGSVTLPKNTSEAVTGHQIAYWDDSAKAVRNASATGRYIIGTVDAALGASIAYCDVTLNAIHVVAI